jgi:hypothetical protein
MNVVVLSRTIHDRKAAMLWLKDKYDEYPDGSIVSSFISQDNTLITAYVVVDQDKLKPPKKKLIKIT